MQRLHLALSITFATFILALNADICSAQGRAVTSSGQTSKVFAAAAAAYATPVKAQVAASSASSSMTTTDAASTSTDDAQEKAHEQKRLAAIKKLKFDRRSSAIIQAWATPEEDESKSEKAKTEDQPLEAQRPLTDEQQVAADKKAREQKLDAELKQFEKQLQNLQQYVTLGNWGEVKSFFNTLPQAEYEALYLQLLSSLQNPVQQPGTRFPQYAEKNVITVDDFFELAALLPADSTEKIQAKNLPQSSISTTQMQILLQQNPQLAAQLKQKNTLFGQLAGVFRISIANGFSIEEYLKRFREIQPETQAAKSEAAAGKPLLTQRQIARLLADSGQAQYLAEFLPALEEAIKQDDREALNLLSRYYLALPQYEKKSEHLEKAWTALQAVLAVGEISASEKEEALKRAVELTPRIKEELGQAWLSESFSKRPERGKEILSSIGAAVALGIQTQSTNSHFRLNSLELQKTAVDALLKAAPEQARAWQSTLQMMASNWLREAQISQTYDYSTSRSRMMQRDYYGNYYYTDGVMMQQQMQRQNQIRAIATGKVLEMLPDEKWMALIDDSLHLEFQTTIAKLYLKVEEEEEAFPYIERLAPLNPREAKSLAEEFLRVWTKNHNPNSEQQRTSIYMFSYGFNQRAQGIPLTRSKQVRNLEELAVWIQRINDLPIEPIDEKLITQAFTQVHSSAEVYQLDAIEKIYGTVDGLNPNTLASLIQTMRTNLGKVWRLPATQKAAKTNRKQKDIEREVLQGYATAQQVLSKAISKYPQSWSVQLAKAALDHDANEFQQELNRTTEFSERRQVSLEGFQKAAELYAAEVEQLEEEKQESTVYETWFYASLGAPDLGKITHATVSDPTQYPLIREAIEGLPGEIGKRHMDQFANSLFVRLSAVEPGVKFRYLQAGFEIVGDHEQAREAKKVYDYYKDLVTEIKLETRIDGSDVVGHTAPFGLFVNLRHTKEIERESGGFSKYLQNQNQGGYYYYNYGRPLENYRDKFEEAAKQSLEEHFEILSITFQSEDVHSRATEEYGWRMTPYAYLLLKPKGPEVDKIPALTLDMDFMDTSGYAVVPVTSAALPIDASPEQGDLRPFKNLQITQTLDEREAKAGKLKLEVRATGVGLIPDLDQIVDLKPKEFDVTAVENEGVSVSQFDKTEAGNAINSERLWLVSMEARPDLTRHPETFSFGLPKQEDHEVTYQRFEDADLVSVEPDIMLQQEYGTPEKSWMVPASVVFAVLILLVIIYRLIARKAPVVTSARYQVPEKITPFTVLGLLKDIERTNGLSPTGKQELGVSISRLEHYYFETPEGEEPDLNAVVHRWVNQTR
ncbi:hypothetical protein [Gimesia sp.]|uniref:hypothetical protein n=1 Tax=Gimesia sp. TaxID=2024833 RepID=UPI000C5EE347|nr:hypothetical protein [Gimesia sp.]MAX37108.1 hypothetical protein [Gimesia sp.]|tara:strand:+ start:7898 stop:11854 length:3957 start_codon:yes stop_codon:yes gene_type:complete